jgi:hypothetical protein
MLSPLWSSGQSSWLQIKIFWNVVGLERGPLSLVSTIEKLLGRNSSGSGLENREYGCGDTLYPQKLALTSPTSGGRSVDIVRLQTKATEFLFVCFLFLRYLSVCLMEGPMYADWKDWKCWKMRCQVFSSCIPYVHRRVDKTRPKWMQTAFSHSVCLRTS